MEGSLVAYKVFTNGSVLPASDVNTYLMDQSVMVFSSSATRAAALTAPVEGMLTWLQDTNKYENYNGSAWVALGGSAILQVVSTAKTNTFTTSSNTFVDVTGLSASITPSSASSKILVFANMASGVTVNSALFYQLVRGSTSIFIGDTEGSRSRVTKSSYTQSSGETTEAFQFLDSPATTSSVTYKMQVRSSQSGQTVAVNRPVADADNAAYFRGASSITLMEVAA
jgi:hypothetical protein